MKFDNSVMPNGPLILVTGVTGYIASYTAELLINDGYRVRDTARHEDSASWLIESFGVDGICHMASMLTLSDKYEEVIPPVVKGAAGIIAAAAPSIKSFVYTSSSTAASMPQPHTKVIVTKNMWDQTVLDKIQNESKPAAVEPYSASKTEAEKVIWSAVEKHKPTFQVATVLPNVNLGTIIHPQGEEHSSTASGWFVNVQGTARLHVSALLHPDCKGERIFAFTAPLNGNDVLAALRKLFPDHKFLDDVPGQGKAATEIPTEDAEELPKKH
ncbi:methylglyoxal reductase (NADPH-dependent) gre2 [Elasticomyces elasticus]|nr:methylglyoxal reductase (NADPH-dependent) gre2 [Elasticomyces elasticus]